MTEADFDALAERVAEIQATIRLEIRKVLDRLEGYFAEAAKEEEASR